MLLDGGEVIVMDIKRILVLDSEQSYRDALITIFRIEGFHAMGAASIQEAVNFLKRREFSVVLIGFDEILDSDDVKILDWIKHRKPGLPMVIMSDGIGKLPGGESLKEIADVFVAKPPQFEDVKRIIRYVDLVTSQ
jgi:DNA-binding NtrC family response regulator